MPLALTNPEGDTVSYVSGQLDHLLAESRKSPRRRMIQPIQRSESAPVQRLLNAFQPRSYVQPHRHSQAGASETIVLLQGRMGVIIYSESGTVIETTCLTPGAVFDLEPNIWHSMICLAPDTVIAEFKQGPYRPMDDKDFATWAPAVDDQPAVDAFLDTTETLFD